jgi:hypothetical protein
MAQVVPPSGNMYAQGGAPPPSYGNTTNGGAAPPSYGHVVANMEGQPPPPVYVAPHAGAAHGDTNYDSPHR